MAAPRRLRLMILCLLMPCSLSMTVASEPSLYFESDVRPILKTHCFHCHGEEPELQGGLDLRLVRQMAMGGDTGAAVEPGNPEASLLLQRIAAGEMPPKGKGLNSAEHATLARWIAQGARTRRPEPDALDPESPWTEEERLYWAFQPVRRPPLPRVDEGHLIRSPIDAFLLARLESAGRSFSPPADRLTLLRRLSLDLLGLPPSPELVANFLADARPDAYERLVDQLLASPAYGERWARHWLDIAGYADSDGYTESDVERPWAYRYRDYLIRSFNHDLPLDQFIVEQLAGDELLTPPYENLSPEQAEKLAATGFLRMVPDGTGESNVDDNVARNDVMAETIKVVSTSLLGMTVGCAQCHDHRYDSISQVDYYRFRAIFEPALDWKNWRAKPSRLISLWQADERARAAEVDAELHQIEGRRVAELDGIVGEIFEDEVAKLPEDKQAMARAARATSADQRSPEQLQLLKEYPSLNVDRGSAYLYDARRQQLQDFNKKYEDLNAKTRAKRPSDNYVTCLTEVPGHVPDTLLFYRGDFNQPRQTVEPADLSVLPVSANLPHADPDRLTSGRRLAFARHLTSGQHPLTARVLANRIWMHHFGRGIVNSPGDFGVLGERPSHPELLDWLADELVHSGWQLKHLHRLLVNSSAYRQSALRPAALDAVDPDNQLLGRMPVRRLEAEVIRDAMIDVAGLRTRTMYGAPAPVKPDDVGQAIIGTAQRDGNGILVAKLQASSQQYRRTLYVQVRRSLPLGVLESLDLATTTPNCERRTSSTVPDQALLMMNNRVTVELAEQFARRVALRVGDDPAAQFHDAWLLAFGREPEPADIEQGQAFLVAQRDYFQSRQAGQAGAADVQGEAEAGGQDELAVSVRALALLCQALFSSNRFLYVD